MTRLISAVSTVFEKGIQLLGLGSVDSREVGALLLLLTSRIMSYHSSKKQEQRIDIGKSLATYGHLICLSSLIDPCRSLTFCSITASFNALQDCKLSINVYFLCILVGKSASTIAKTKTTP